MEGDFFLKYNYLKNKARKIYTKQKQ